jgi:hypothetical protein
VLPPLAAAGRSGSMHSMAAGRKLQQQTTQSPLAATFETLPWKVPVISVAMTQIPTAGTRNRKYFAYWRALAVNQTQSAATLDLDSRKVQTGSLTVGFVWCFSDCLVPYLQHILRLLCRHAGVCSRQTGSDGANRA